MERSEQRVSGNPGQANIYEACSHFLAFGPSDFFVRGIIYGRLEIPEEEAAGIPGGRLLIFRRSGGASLSLARGLHANSFPASIRDTPNVPLEWKLLSLLRDNAPNKGQFFRRTFRNISRKIKIDDVSTGSRASRHF